MRLLLLALLIVLFPATAAENGPVIEKAQHVVNPMPPVSPDTPRAELHGEVVLREEAGVAESVVVTVRMLEQTLEFPVGTLKAGQTSSTEWSMQRVGDDRPIVEITVEGTCAGRGFKRITQSREVTPPDPRRPGEAPPGY